MSDMRDSIDWTARDSFSRVTDVLAGVWDGAGAWVARGKGWRITDISTMDAARIRGDLRQHVERAMQDLGARRTRTLASLEDHIAGVVETVARRVPVSRGEVAELRQRLAGVEGRLELLVRQVARRRGAAQGSDGDAGAAS